MKELMQQAMAIQEELIGWRREMHMYPELGQDLPKTKALVWKALEEMGYTPSMCGDGITALAGGKNPGRCILLRADMDALPVKEEVDIPCKSTNENMHACGHDFHTAMLLGAAKLLKGAEDKIQGSVKLMFQPGEELLTGAKDMVENGILENPRVDAAAMFHVVVGMPAPAGLVIVPNPGPISAASDGFELVVQGKGGHGAMPNEAIDPVVASAHILLALQTIRSRELAGGDNAVITIGKLSGGTVNNVIPDTAQMLGTIRTFDPAVRAMIPKRIEEIAKGVAGGLRCEAGFKLNMGCPSVVVEKALADSARRSMTEMFGAQAVPPIEALGISKLSSSEDFSFVSEKVPAVMMCLTAGGIEPEYGYPMHHPKAKYNEAVLAQGAAAYAGVALGFLGQE